jgi:hypothetical protein
MFNERGKSIECNHIIICKKKILPITVRHVIRTRTLRNISYIGSAGCKPTAKVFEEWRLLGCYAVWLL